MTEASCEHRLDGLEPDNLLAFLALLGLLVALEHARPRWRPRVRWSWNAPPVRPVLVLREAVAAEELCEEAAHGLDGLLAAVDFGSLGEIKMSRESLKSLVSKCPTGSSMTFQRELIAALVVDDPVVALAEACLPTPLAYATVATSNFLRAMLATAASPLPERRRGDPNYPKTPGECLSQAIQHTWRRRDRPVGLRWDYAEAKRHAYRFSAPTTEPPKTQHGASRLAIAGLAQLTSVPVVRQNRVRPMVFGGHYSNGRFTVAWPIWTSSISIASIKAILLHPALRSPETLQHLGVQAIMVSTKLSDDRLSTFGPGRRLPNPRFGQTD